MNGNITNAAGIYVLEPIDNNFKTGGGAVSIGACCLVASKGKPFTPLEVNPPSQYWNSDVAGSQEAIFGKPLPKKAYGMEGLRHLADAARDCNRVEAVRVVNSARYRYPALSFLLFADQGEFTAGTPYRAGDVIGIPSGEKFIALQDVPTTEPAPSGLSACWAPYSGPVESSSHTWNERVLVGDDGLFMVLYPVDGSDSVNRTVSITDVRPEKRRFTLSFYDKNDSGEAYLLEAHEVGISEDDKDDMGIPAYIETVLESKSRRFRCDFLEGTTWEQLETVLLALESTKGTPRTFVFTGGASGGEPETEDWLRGADMFRRESLKVNLLFAAGETSPDYIARLAEIADDRHISFFFDTPTHLTSTQAEEWVKDLGLRSRHSRCYYGPFEANDSWRGGKTVWGVSGAMAAAKARCNANFSKDVPGVHFSPAGAKRSTLARTGVKPLHPDDHINRDNF